MTTKTTTPEALRARVRERRVVDHPWVQQRLLAGKVSREEAQDVALELVGLYDHLIRLYGPMYMNSADHRVRRLFTDKLLTELELDDGSSARIGEGAHADLARQFALALDVPRDAAASATPSERLAFRIDQLVGTLELPPYRITLGACAAVELENNETLYPTLGKAFAEQFELDANALAIFDAPGLFTHHDIEQTSELMRDEFDELRVGYYVERVRDAWFECWATCFEAAGDR